MTDFSLRDVAKQRLLEMIRSVETPNGLKVLIVDQESVRIISAACRMYDIIEEGITLVEKIEIARQPLPKLEAIYFISPSPATVDALIKDFKDKKEPQYAAVHLFFTRRLPDEELNKIKKEAVVGRVKTLKEVNLDFIAYESACFHCDLVTSFKNLFSPESTENGNEQEKIAEKIASVCATLKEYPMIRYHATKDNSSNNNSASGGLTHHLATLVQDKLDKLVRGSSEFASSLNSSNRSTLVILDRTVDPIAPILHEFTYQAMVYDMLPIENDHYKFKSVLNTGESKEKEVLLSEQDPLWPTLRHMHIAETMNWMTENFNSFRSENKVTKMYNSGKKVNNLKEMSEAMRAMPQFREMLDKYSIHINLSTQCMDEFGKQQLERIAAVEQDMATGEDPDGKPVKNVISSMPPLLTDPEIPVLNKLRLLMLYIISQEGIKDSDRKRLMELAKISHQDQGCISNLRYLGVTLLRGTKAKKTQKLKDKKKSKQRDDAPPYELSRYVPVIKQIGGDFLENSANTSDFPFLKEDPSVEKAIASGGGATAVSYRTSAAPKWANKDKRKSEKTSSAGSKLILFIAGGVTYSEIRSIYELAEKYKRDVIIGSSSILTPTAFVEGLRELKKVDIVDDDLL